MVGLSPSSQHSVRSLRRSAGRSRGRNQAYRPLPPNRAAGRCVAGNRSQLHVLGDEGSQRRIDARNERGSKRRLEYLLPQGNQWKVARSAERRRA